MFEIMEASTETCIGFKVTGKVAKADYDLLLPKLDEAIEAQGKINLVVVLEDFDGWAELDAAKADFDFGTTQYRDVERAAFVSDKKWHKWMVKIMDPFTRHTDEAYFDLSQLQAAWDWACQGQ
jgi:hypothetical protein